MTAVATSNTQAAVVEFAGISFPVLMLDQTFLMRARDLGRALGYSSDGKALVKKLGRSSKFREGRDFRKLSGDEARAVDSAVSRVSNVDTVGAFRGSTIVLTEAGVYKVLITSEQDEANAFQDWLSDEVLPALRRGERVNAPQPQPEEPSAKERRLMAAENRRRGALGIKAASLLAEYGVSDEAVTLVLLRSTELATGVSIPLKALPQMEERMVTATEIGAAIGVHANTVAASITRIRKADGPDLRNDDSLGKTVLTTTTGAPDAKQVQQRLYTEAAVRLVLEELNERRGDNTSVRRHLPEPVEVEAVLGQLFRRAA
jgi:prophage antirepressor-like protein